MHTLNRAALLIKPRQPYREWANRTAQSDETMEELIASSKVLLVPLSAYDDLDFYLKENFNWIFEMELEAWNPVTTDWPKSRSMKIFKEWFEVEPFVLVVDAPDQAPVREPYWPED
jgi:hypothetical protein